MIISIIKKNVDEFLSSKIWIMAFAFSIVGLSLLQSAKGANLTYWEFIISAITDHYYILYFMIIFYLFSVFKMVEDYNSIILIRTRRYINYFIAQVISLFLISMIFVLIHLLIVVIMGCGLKVDNRFTINANYFGYNEVIGVYATYFKTPLLAIGCNIVYMIFGLTFMGVVLICVNHFLDKRLVIICMVVMYLVMLISLRTDVDKYLPMVFMNNYVILHHALEVLGDKFYVMILGEIVLSGCILFIIRKFWYKDITFKKIIILKSRIIKWYLKKLFSIKNIFIMLIFSIISIINIMLKYDNLTIHDLTMLQFYGHGIGYFDFMDFMSLVIYNSIPIYLLAYFLEKDSNDTSIFVTIRFKNKKHWFMSIMSCGFLFIFIYVIISLCIGVIMGAIIGLKFNGYHFMNDLFVENGLNIISPYYLYLIILTTKTLELFFYYLIVVTCYVHTRGCTLGYLLVQAGYGSYFFTGDIGKYTPVGMGSLSRIGEFVGNQGIPYCIIMILLVIINAVLFLYLRCGAYKRIFN